MANMIQGGNEPLWFVHTELATAVAMPKMGGLSIVSDVLRRYC